MSYKDISIPPITVQNLTAETLGKTLKEALEQNEDQWKANREMLVDFYRSRQTDNDDYLRKYFNVETDVTKEPDYPHNLILSQVNMTGKIIRKKAKTYKKQPLRRLGEKVAEDYARLLKEGKIGPATKFMDRMTWLLGDHCVVIIADGDTKKLRFDQPVYYRPIFQAGNSIEPIGVMYPSGLYPDKDNRLVSSWQYWDAKKHLILEEGSWETLKQEPNPHGVFNAMFTHKVPPSDSHWTEDAQDVVDMNRDINIALTSVNNAMRYHGFPIMAAIGVDEKTTKNVKVRFDKIITVTADPAGKESVDLKLLVPSVDWDALMNTIKTRVELMATTWNVDIRWELAGEIASGVALRILSLDDLDDRTEMQELYEAYFEEPLHAKLVAMSNEVEWIKIPEGELTIDWPEEETIESPGEKTTRLKGQVELNMTNPIDEMKKDNPDLDDTDAARMFLRNVKVNKLMQKPIGLTVDAIMAAMEGATDEEVNDLLEIDEEEEPAEDEPPVLDEEEGMPQS